MENQNHCMADKHCMFLDLETGGFNSEKHAICEIGFLVFNTKTNEIISKSAFKIKPYIIDLETGVYGSYTEEALKINGNTEESLERIGFSISTVLTVLESVIKTNNVVFFGGHNLEKFDIRFLDKAYNLYMGKGFTYEALVCTLEMSRKRLKLKSHKLTDLCKYFEMEPKKYHTALADTEASYEVFQKLRHLPFLK